MAQLRRRLFRHLTADERWSTAVEEASDRGVVIYILPEPSAIEVAALAHLIEEASLPRLHLIGDHRPSWIGWLSGSEVRSGDDEGSLAEVLREGRSALLFLWRAPFAKAGQGSPEAPSRDLLQTLVRLQRTSSVPFFLVPQLFVWTKDPDSREPVFLDRVFGGGEAPGDLRALALMAVHREASLRAGEALDLRTFMLAHPELSEAELTGSLRLLLLRRIEAERRVVLGPVTKAADRLREEILRSPRVRDAIRVEAERRGEKEEALKAEARAIIERLAARYDPVAVRSFGKVLQWLWGQIYEELEIDQEGLERVRRAARTGPLVIVPSHKSHVDYLVISATLFGASIMVPMIAAGENLDFFPLGGYLRRSGAFFIRRSFKGDALYTAIVAAYLRKLLVEGFHIEFFIEGGRSRTGTIQPPKLGMLGMLVDAGLRLRSKRIHFVPVSVSYDRVIEVGSYAREGSGAPKKKEGLGSLLSFPRIVRSSYGRLYVGFGEIFTLGEERSAQLKERPTGEVPADGDPERGGLSPRERRTLVERLALRITREIDKSSVITPATLLACALLIDGDSAVSREGLSARCRTLYSLIEPQRPRLSRSLAADGALRDGTLRDGTLRQGTLREGAIEEAIALFVDAKLLRARSLSGRLRYEVPESARLSLEYHKNGILHFFVPSALVASCLLGSSGGRETGPALLACCREQALLLRHQLTHYLMPRFEEAIEEALDQLEQAGAVGRGPEGEVAIVGERGRELLGLHFALLRPFLEATLLALWGIAGLEDRSVKKKRWHKEVQALGKTALTEGRLLHAEALSRHKIESALKALAEHRLMVIDGDLLRGEPGADPSPIEARLAAGLRCAAPTEGRGGGRGSRR